MVDFQAEDSAEVGEARFEQKPSALSLPSYYFLIIDLPSAVPIIGPLSFWDSNS